MRRDLECKFPEQWQILSGILFSGAAFVLHHIGGIYGHSPCLHTCVSLLGDGICGCRLAVFGNILCLRKQPRLVLFHRKKVMGVLSNYFLGDVNLGAHSVNADHAIKTKLDIYFC